MNHILNHQLWIKKEAHYKKFNSLLREQNNSIKKAAEKRRKLFFNIKFQNLISLFIKLKLFCNNFYSFLM